MTIKEGTLVKAWDDDISGYVITTYRNEVDDFYFKHVTEFGSHKNAIEIPPALLKQLADLSK